VYNRVMLSAIKKLKASVVGILILASGIRLLGITSRPIWYDEAFSILFSEKGPLAMVYGTLTPTGTGAADVHPLGYYTLLWLWMKVFGESLIAARLLSIIAGIAAVAIVYRLASEMFDQQTGILASLLIAISPFHVHYSQEIRMYSFLALWLMLATFAYWKATQTGKVRWWVLFAISAAVAQYTHNLAAFYLIPLAVTPIIHKDWKTLKAISIAGGFALLLYLPWLVNLPAQFAKVNQAYWIERPSLARLLTLLLTFTTNLPLPDSWLGPGLFIALVVTAVALFQTYHSAKKKVEGWDSNLWVLYLTFVPPIFLFFFSQWKPIYLERALLPSGMMFSTWLAWALFRTATPRFIQYSSGCMILLASTIGIYYHVTYNGFPYGAYQELDESLREVFSPGDVIVHSSKLSLLPSVYYDRLLPETYIADAPGSGIDTLAPSTQQVLGLESQPDIQTATDDAKRVWFIIFERSNQEYVQAGYPYHPQLAWLLEHYSLKETREWGQLQVYLFSRGQ